MELQKTELIRLQINELFKFIQSENDIKNDFDKYIASIKNNLTNENQFQAAMANYAFERKLESNDKNSPKSISHIYLERNKKTSKENKELFETFADSISAIFKIEKIEKNGFHLYNMVNEKNYFANSLVKINKFKHLTPCQYITGRILKYKKEYYLLEITNILPSTAKTNAYQVAVMKQLNTPSSLYKDNDEKFKEIKNILKKLNKKFETYFAADEFITTTQYVDEILNSFNEFADSNKRTCEAIDIPQPQSYGFFSVKEINSGINDFSDAISQGFSSHEKTYDVGVLFDKELGLSVLPFYGTFKKIFNSDDYKSIEGYKNCIKNYLSNPKITPVSISRVYNKNPDNFMKIINEVLNEQYSDINELLQKYKSAYFNEKLLSAPTVLYSSQSFNDLMSITENQQNMPEIDDKKVGRNDPCPCGSGKKYKKCCLLKTYMP